jgi:hypothetical protein
MGKMTYKKRAKSGWCSDKHESNKDERQYEKKELKQELNEYEQGDEFRYRHIKKKKKKTEEERLRSNISYYNSLIAKWSRYGLDNGAPNEWLRDILNGYKHSVNKYEKQLLEITRKRKDNESKG